ncbi:hypothetical protein L0337_03440 [candidate division KSB1 bacterium]|nr:hypothetical protein [candidate division KSB1 bacterium]
MLPAKHGKVIITVTCDWDGLDYPLNESYNPAGSPHFRFDRGIQAIKYFNRKFADRIPVTHFICPVYFTRSHLLAEYYAGKTAQLVQESNCEIGLHIHCWISLMRVCGVALKDPVRDHSIPDWGAQENNRYGLCVPYRNDAGEEKIDYGHGVPLGVYRQEEIQQVVERCRVLLVENKIIQSSGDCVSFRCGGWMANDLVLAAVQMVEPLFQYEASAVDASFFANGGGTMHDWLAQLWGPKKQTEASYLANRLFLSAYPSGINVYDHANDVTAAQPRKIQRLLEIPDTAILADYVQADYMKEQIHRAMELATQQNSEVYLSLGFHLESGGDSRFGRILGHIERVIEALEYVEQHDAMKDSIEYLTIAEAGKRFLQA